jgi:hypothetical protein
VKRLENAFGDLAGAVKVLPTILSECEECAVDIEEVVEKIIDELEHPIDLIIDSTKNIFWHGKEIAGDVWHSVIDYNNEDFKEAGHDLGDIIWAILLSSK